LKLSSKIDTTNKDNDENISFSGQTIQEKTLGNRQTTYRQNSFRIITGLRKKDTVKESSTTVRIGSGQLGTTRGSTNEIPKSENNITKNSAKSVRTVNKTKDTYESKTTNTFDPVAHKRHIEYSKIGSRRKGPPDIPHLALHNEHKAQQPEEPLPQGDEQDEIFEKQRQEKSS
jgi:hypothetical protein